MNTVARALIAEVETRFRKLGKKECFVSNYPPGYFTPGIDPRAYPKLLQLFMECGYAQFHEALSMDASIVLFEFSDTWKQRQQILRNEGIEIRPYRRPDLMAFLDFLERTMPSDWVRVGRRNLRRLCEGGFHEEQITLATMKDDIIGYCQFEGSHFGPFGVSDKYQGKGIGTMLLGRTIERMRQEGFHDAWVMWTDDIAAKVYQKFGFKETRRFALLKREL
jgi:GNAT superfamily N-acetyltransferase